METKNIEQKNFNNLSEDIKKSGYDLIMSMKKQTADMANYIKHLHRVANLLNIVGGQMLLPSQKILHESYRLKNVVAKYEYK